MFLFKTRKPTSPRLTSDRVNTLATVWGLFGTLALIYALLLDHTKAAGVVGTVQPSLTKQLYGNHDHRLASPSNGSASLTRDVLHRLITSTSRNHGLQQKAGMPVRWRTQLAHMTNTQPHLHGLPASQWSPEIMQWMQKIFRVADPHSAAANSPSYRSPVPSCHYYIDHKYKIIYVRTTKAGGTTLSRTLGYKENPAVCAANKDACYAHCTGKQLCLSYSFDPAELEKHWKDYTVFGFVRNPLSRAVSSWAHIGKYGLERECHRPFADFAALPPAYGAPACAAYDRCCRQKFGWLLEHLEDQASCLLDLNGAPAVDFLGRVEELEEDFQELVELVNARRPSGTPELAVPKVPRLMATDDTNAAGAKLGDPGATQATKPISATLKQYVDLYSNGTALADIIRYYQPDFQLLGFGEEVGGLLRQAGLEALADELVWGSNSSAGAGGEGQANETSSGGMGDNSTEPDLVDAALRTLQEA